MLYWVNQYAVTPDQPGGTRHWDMSRELNRRGLSTTIVASDFNLSKRAYLRRTGHRDRRHLREEVAGVPMLWLPAGHYRMNDWRRAASMIVFSLHVLLFLLRAPAPAGTVFIGSSPHLLAAAATRLAAALRRVPFVLEVRDLWPESLEVGGERRRVAHAALRVLADALYRSSSAIIVLAAGSIDTIADRGVNRDHIHHVPNGVDVSAFDGAVPRRIEGVPPDREVFVYAGAHGPANGLDIALDAAEELARRGEARAQITLVGDGPSKDALVTSAKQRKLSNVTFADPVPKSDVPGLLRSCTGGLMLLADVDLFAYGVSPNKLFDYLAAGLHVITNVPGDVARVVEESGSGTVVPPSNPLMLADAIVAVLDTPSASGSGLEWVAAHHDRQRLVVDLERVIAGVRG